MGTVSVQTEFANPKLVIIGGGPGGYEAALVAASLGAEVTVIEEQGMGGSAVLTDVVPSKTLIASADTMNRFADAKDLGVHVGDGQDASEELNNLRVDLDTVNVRLLRLAATQSRDIKRGLERVGVRVVQGRGRLADQHTVVVSPSDDDAEYELHANVVLLAVGSHPREMDTAKPDGERIFNWKQIYQLTEIPEKLIVVGSGVTGAEFASAYNGLGSEVTLISSREQVLPGSDTDAAQVLENVFERRGLRVLSRSRADSVENTGDGVRVTLSDGRKVRGSHCLLAVGSIPNTADMGLEEAGVAMDERGHIKVDSVSRTSVPGIYAAGDCTGVLPLASVAAMQGRIAVAHILGDTVHPLHTDEVASNIFTSPEIASVGISQSDVEADPAMFTGMTMKLSTNPRAKMMAVDDGFVKIFARRGSGTVMGGVVVGPRASELIFPIALAVTHRLGVDDLSDTFAVYPSLSGTIAEAARRLHVHR
ncbi:NAD(P)H-quinone dehydrogenase [Kocuria marina]|uniref:NAD(P)H-quinone dehydrogenase n=1 Tax=Kocuria marina TaxID=223184 RepID=UPI00345F9AB5